jgi:hypothetical protein
MEQCGARALEEEGYFPKKKTKKVEKNDANRAMSISYLFRGHWL